MTGRGEPLSQLVMAALEAAIQPLHHKAVSRKNWMAGSKPGHGGLRNEFSRQITFITSSRSELKRS